MKLFCCSLVLVLTQALGMNQNAAASDVQNPSDVVRALYHSAIHNFGFSPESVKANREWLAPELYARILKKVNEPTPKGEVGDIEGDLFLDSQDVPTTFEVAAASIDQTKAQVKVTLTWSQEKRHYTVLLEELNGAWKVDDVNYGEDGKLTDLLK